MRNQGKLFEDVEVAQLEKESNTKLSEWGTFRDSLRAPVHRWFTYPAGFSYKAVEHSIKKAKLTPGKDTIYDPFMGSGTTNIVARTLGFNSIGVEAHPFVYRITKSKMNWDISRDEINKALDEIQLRISKKKQPKNLDDFLSNEFPELVLKCYLKETLYELFLIREYINECDCSIEAKELLRTGLICVLRDVSIAATGWSIVVNDNGEEFKMGYLNYLDHLRMERRAQ